MVTNLAYYSICSGIILVCDAIELESILFIEKQIEKILSLKCENKKILIIANIRFLTQNLPDKELKISQMKFTKCDEHLRDLARNFDIDITYADLLYFTEENKNLRKFLSSQMKKKEANLEN